MTFNREEILEQMTDGFLTVKEAEKQYLQAGGSLRDFVSYANANRDRCFHGDPFTGKAEPWPYRVMTHQDLYDAADRIDAKAAKFATLNTDDPLRDKQAREVAQQLRDRAQSVRMSAGHAERTGRVTPDMEASTNEYLRYVGA